MPPNLSFHTFSESNTILFLTLASIFLSEGEILEGNFFYVIVIITFKMMNNTKPEELL